MREEAAVQFVSAIFPTERMDQMLDAIVNQSLEAHTEGDYTSIAHHAIVSTIEFTEEEPDKPVYEVFTIPSPNLRDMHEFAGFVGSLVARMAPDKVLVGAWLVGEAWMVETKAATPTKVLPSEHPDKQEIIVIAGVALDKRHNHAIIRIDRDDKGMIRIPEGGVDKFHVDDNVPAYSRNTKALLEEYLKEAGKRL
jgi:hypothetical protein